MAGKTIESRAPIGFDALKAQMEARLTADLFSPPHYDTPVETTILKDGEREHIALATRSPDGTYNNPLWHRLTVAYGMTAPKLAEDKEKRAEAIKIAAMLEEFPSDWIEAVSEHIWERTNAYRQQRSQDGADGPAFFLRRSGSSTGSSTASTSPPTSSSPGDKSA
jgi:hypothetical protein